MWNYDGQTFTTYAEFLAYLSTKFGNMYDANYASIAWWGCDLDGNYLFVDGIQQVGTEGARLAAEGLNSAQDVLTLYDANPVEFSRNTIEQLNQLKQSQEAIIEGTKYTNSAIQLGTETSQGGQVLVATKPVVTDNGSVFNNPKVMTAEKVEDPLVPGTFSYLATLKALGWLPVPAWLSAVAPLLGVGLGVGLYELNPEFWEKVSRTLLPFAYDDDGVSKMPISVDSDGNVHTPEAAIEAIRQLFIEEGVYNTGGITPPESLNVNVPYTYETSSSGSGTLQYTNYNRCKPYFRQFAPVRSATIPHRIGIAPADTETPIYELTSNMCYGVYYAYQSSEYAAYVYLIDADKIPLFDNVPVNTNVLTRLYDMDNGEFYGTAAFKKYKFTFTYNNIEKTIYTISSSINGTYSDMQNAFGEGATLLNDLAQLDLAATFAYLFGEQSLPVDGMTPESGATYPTDTTKNLAEIYPQWANGGISVINNPLGTTIEDSTERWYPVSLSNTNYSNDTNETSSTQNQTDAQSGSNTDSAQMNQIAQALQELTETLTESGVLTPNPVVPSDPSGDTPSPTPPVITGAGSDLISIYNPTKTQIQAFNQFLWDLDPTNILNWQKVIQNPIDAIISLHMIYVTPITGSPQHIKCGYIETDVSSKVVTNQYVDIDCGTVDVDEYFHNIWDYIATDIQIYLPFIGIVPLHVSDIMNSTMRVKYRVDVYTGTCLAQIIVYKETSFAVLYTYTGNCAVSLPLSGGSFSNIMSTLIVMGGLVMSGNAGTAATYAMGRASRGELMQHIQRSGNIGANAGAMGIRTPYLIITRKKPLDAYLYQEQYGFPANKTVVLGDMRGYTRVKNIHLHGIPCTDDELEMIERLLKDGVIIN